jgi:WD40 repeat protein/transcriptional regulator with XRE-family HTH domain
MGTSHTAETFRGLLLQYRGRSGLTQRQLAARVGAHRRTLQDWEAGVNYPSAERLRALLRVLLDAGALTMGREVAEAEELWISVVREAPRTQTPFDVVWWGEQVDQQASSATRQVARTAESVTVDESARTPTARYLEWADAPDVLGFVGRVRELANLRTWVLEERCRLVGLLGMGGIGKTTLAARLAEDLTPGFARLYWRSLRDALPMNEWLVGVIGFLSDQQVVPPEGEVPRLEVLLQLMRERQCLLVLDNFETLLEPGQREARYRDGYAGYGRLLQSVGSGRHRSCLVVTSREAPPELAALEGAAVHTLELGGMEVADGQALLADKQLSGTTEAWTTLIDRLGGNGLALKVVGESIRQVFGGELGAFLEMASGVTLFGGIGRLIAEQIDRSSSLEQRVLRMLALERGPVTLAQLIAEMGAHAGRGAVVGAIEALRRRSLVERAEMPGTAAFTLQSVVLEYLTDRLVASAADEIEHGRLALLIEHPLVKAQTKDYIRDTQERLIGKPILVQLQSTVGDAGAERLLLGLLDAFRGRPPRDQGYAPGNAINLLRLARGDLQGVDLSCLSVRQAYLAGVNAQNASLRDAHLTESVLAEAFYFPTSVALSAEGALLVTGTSAGEVWLWRVADRTPLLTVQGHTGAVWGVALSAEGQLLASGGGEGTLRLWDARSGRSLGTLLGHTGGIRCVALAADGHLLASGSDDETVRLWDAATGQLLATLHGHTGAVTGVAVSADGQLVASCGADGTGRLWEASTGRPVSILQPDAGAIRGVALSADAQLLVTGGLDGTVRLWQAPFVQETPLATLRGHTSMVRGVALSADGQVLASGSFDGELRLWEARTGLPLATLQGPTGTVWGVALSADGQLVACSGGGGAVRLWEARPGLPVATLQGQTGIVWGVALSADGRLVANGSDDGTLRLWDASTGVLLATLEGHTGAVTGVALSADGKLMASAGADGLVRLWATSTGQPLSTLQGHVGTVWCVAVSADGRLVASGSDDETVLLWDATTGLTIATLRGHTGAVTGVALSADGSLVASVSDHDTLRLWGVSAGHPIATLQGHTGGATDVALSADGQVVATGGRDGTVRLWGVGTARRLANLRGYAGMIRSVALSADGQLLVSGGLDGTVRLWRAPFFPARPPAILRGHTSMVRDVALSADGQVLASGSFDGSVRVWESGTGACLHELRGARRYERMDITGLTGVTAAQRVALLALGAVEQPAPATQGG